jgi:hypothetical protein
MRRVGAVAFAAAVDKSPFLSCFVLFLRSKAFLLSGHESSATARIFGIYQQQIPGQICAYQQQIPGRISNRFRVNSNRFRALSTGDSNSTLTSVAVAVYAISNRFRAEIEWLS